MTIIRIFHRKESQCNKTTDMSKPATKDTARPSMKVNGTTNVMKWRKMCLGKGMERSMSGKEQRNIKLKGTMRE